MIETPFNLEFDSLEKEIRYGLQPDNPGLLVAYITMADNMVEQSRPVEIKLNILFRVANNLLDAICDTYIPEHWRHCCLDVIYRPIRAMEKIISTDKHTSDKNKIQLSQFKYELNTLGAYFFN